MTVTEHLLDRGLDLRCYKHVHVCEEECVATFVLHDLHGRVTGTQTYRPGQPKNTAFSRSQKFDPRMLKYFTRPALGQHPFFGAETFDRSKSTLYLTEGVFDAVKLHTLGLNAFAMLGNDPVPNKQMLRLLNMTVVGVLDGDPSGEQLADFCDKVFICPPGKDPGGMTQSELKELLQL